MPNVPQIIEIPDDMNFAIIRPKPNADPGQRTIGLMLHYANGRLWVRASRLHWNGSAWAADDRQWEIGSLQLEPNPQDGDAWKGARYAVPAS